ncbi:MAG TPA: NADP-dependent oxidoreductase [Steroidobacteraceae bacterium]
MRPIAPLLFILLLAGTAEPLGAQAPPGPSAAPALSMQAAVAAGGRVPVRTVARPVATPGQVLVKLRFAGVNPADWKAASGRPEQPEPAGAAASAAANIADEDTAAGPARGAIPGVDGSGIIVALGAGVHDCRIGEPVILWSAARGTYAQYVVVAAGALVRKPAALSYEQAAGLAHAGLAAWNMLVQSAHVRPGEHVLVLGGAGGVGSAAVQIARNEGAHVTATGSGRNAAYLRSLGAEQVIDYTREHFEEQVRDADIVVNTVDADDAYRGLAVLRRGGFLVSVNGLPRPEQCAARGVHCVARTLGAPVGPVLRQLAEWSRTGRFTVNIDRVFELSEVVKAWGYSQAGRTRGKSVIRIGD